MRQGRPVWPLLTMAAAIIIFAHVATPAHSKPPGDHWVLTFSEDFDKPALDSARWSSGWYPGLANVGNGQLHHFVDDAIVIEDGRLKIRADRRAYNGYAYTSGMIHTRNKFSQERGYFEIRARWPKGSGLWSSFWLLPKSQTFPPEVDFEFLGRTPKALFTNVHYTSADGQRGQSGWWYSTSIDLTADFHTYALEWTPEELIWYMDGVVLRRHANVATLPGEPMYLLLDLSIGGWWADVGSPNSTSFPQYFEVDYVRVWQDPAWVREPPTPSPTPTPPEATAEPGGPAAPEPEIPASSPTSQSDPLPSPAPGGGAGLAPTSLPGARPTPGAYLPLITRP